LAINIAKEGTFVFLSRLIETFSAMLNSIVITRMLGPEGRGKYALFLTILLILLTPATLGISESNLYMASSKKSSINSLISNSFLFAFVSSFLWITIFFIFYKILIYRLIPSLTINEIFVMLCILPFIILFIYLQNILIGIGSINHFIKTNIVLSVSPLFFIIFFLFDNNLIVSEAIYAYMLSYLTSCVYCIWICIKKTGTFHFTPSKELAIESLKYGAKISPGTILQGLRDRLEVLIISHFMSASAVGYYSVAQGLSERLKLLPKSFSYILFAQISGSTNELRYSTAAYVTRNTLWFMIIIIIIPLIASAKFIISILYGREFLPAIIPLCILFFSTMFSSIGLTLGSLALGKGSPQICTYAMAISFLTTIGLDIWLIPVWGLIGAAIANTSGLAIMAFFYLAIFRKETKIKLVKFLLIQKEDFKNIYIVSNIIRNKFISFFR
jgi:O-antigen/teichoic acid export membrane protein